MRLHAAAHLYRQSVNRSFCVEKLFSRSRHHRSSLSWSASITPPIITSFAGFHSQIPNSIHSCAAKMATGKVSLRDLLYYSIKAAELGGNQVRDVVQSGVLETTYKERNVDPVTVGDIRSHQVMVGLFQRQKFGVTIISEEDDSTKPVEPVDLAVLDVVAKHVPEDFVQQVGGDEEASVGDVTVWIDPLDATQEYTEGLYEFVQVMVGIAVKGRPVAGVLHRPFLKTPITYWAWENHGMCPELKSLRRPERDFLKIVMSRTASHAGNVLGFTQTALAGRKFELVPRGGAGDKLLQVILGDADAYLHITKIKKWDLCAGHGILRALGGCLTMLDGDEINYSPPKDKQEVLVHKGFIGTFGGHDWLVAGTRKAYAEMKK
ncbi:inositol monophosphatase 3-like [Paramacrobiotus metropolitanus]|uniref:inositol monophosphatase 3-like n=1 Tax=Paramacrobiotus metropolitanus TaxID=2943436 RepID=UPI0024459463|nr:inositol monophosphatase 3-like [Paramacrobiotus metropolitanus]